jgi:hypothetical protein
MQGRIPLGDDAADNILTEIYGEIIGPLVTCLERGGEYEIVRLERQDGADLLLVNKQSWRVILQECKATFADYAKARADPSSLDVCQQMRNQRNKGKRQLRWPDADEIGGSRRVRVRGTSAGDACPIPHAEETVVVTTVPDGRLQKCATQIIAPVHDPCSENCVKRCLFSPEPALLCVLSSEQINSQTRLDEGMRAFLGWYKTCERAIWGNAHGSLGNALASVLSSARQLELPMVLDGEGSPILMGLIERAVERNVYVDFGPIFEVSETLRQPALSRCIRQLHDLQGDMPRPRVTDVEPQELGRMLSGAEGESQEERLIGNWRFLAAGPRSEGEGTMAEASIQETSRGYLEMRFVPRELALRGSPDDLCWGISTVLSGDRFPPEYVYELFTEEIASWGPRPESREGVGEHSIVLGQTLSGGDLHWPFWLTLLERGTLRDMHSCCPECDMVAGWIEGHWPFPPRAVLPRHRRRHGRHRTRIGGGDHPWAFVANDARGFVSMFSVVR